MLIKSPTADCQLSFPLKALHFLQLCSPVRKPGGGCGRVCRWRTRVLAGCWPGHNTEISTPATRHSYFSGLRDLRTVTTTLHSVLPVSSVIALIEAQLTSHDLTWPHMTSHDLACGTHCLPGLTQHQDSSELQSNQRMFVSATHEVLKFLPTEDLRFKYVGHQGQGTRSEVSNKSWSYKYWDACREQGGREGGREGGQLRSYL